MSGHFKKFNRVAVMLTAFFLSLTVYSLYPVFASPPSTPYAPGETTDPSCSPGDPNCSVYAPLSTSLTSSTNVNVGTSTLSFNTNTLYIDGANNLIGIGTSTPAAKLHVIRTAEQLRLGYNGANYSSFTVGSDGALTITPTNSATMTISNGLSVGGALLLSGTANLQGALSNSAGFLTISDSLDITGNVTTTGNIVLTGTSNLQGALSNSGGYLTISDDLDITGNVTTTGNLVLTGTSDMRGALSNSTGDLAISDNLTISGNATTSGGLVIVGALQVVGTGTLATTTITSSTITTANIATLNVSNVVTLPANSISSTHLISSGVTANTYGSASAAPVLTVDADGRITLASTSSIAIVTSSVSGVFAFANGGTGASTFANGGLVFSDGTIFTQDSSNLFWDDTNNKFGINTTTPGAKFHVVTTTEQLRLGYDASDWASFLVGTDGALTVSTTNSATTTIKNGLVVDTNTLVVDRASDRVGIGTSTPVSTLSVAGNTTISGTIYTNVGTVSTPSLAFIGDTDTGLYNIGADTTGLATGGVLRLQVGATAMSSTLPFYAPNGAEATPSITFNSDTDSGFFRQNADTIAFSTGGAERIRFGTNSFITNLAIRPYDNASLPITGAIDDGATAIGVKIGNVNALSTAGAKIVSFYSNNLTVEKVAIGVNGEVMAATGTVSLPSLSFLNDTNTGLYSYAADTIGLSTGGVLRAVVDSVGKFGVNTNTPSTTLHIVTTTEQLRLGYDASDWASFLVGTDGALTVSTTNSATTTIKNGLVVNSVSSSLVVDKATGRVGINIASPAYTLDVKSQSLNSYVIQATASDGSLLGGILEDSSGASWLYLKQESGTAKVALSTNATSYFNGGSVGIGTTVPGKVLDINSATGVNLRLTYNDADGSASAYTDFLTGADGALTIVPANNVTTTVSSTLLVRNLTSNGAVYSNGGVLTNVNPSSREYKDNIQPLDLRSDRLLQLQPVSYVWKANEQNDFGYIAEDVGLIFPELYQDSGGMRGYQSSKLIFYAIDLLKKQQLQINALAGSASASLPTASVAGLRDTVSANVLHISGDSAFGGKLAIEKRVILGKDAVGEVIIKSKIQNPNGQSNPNDQMLNDQTARSVRVVFEEPYDNLPIVTISPMDFVEVAYKVASTTKEGFYIVLERPQTRDARFSWHAFESADDAKVFVSDGAVNLVNMLVVENPNDQTSMTNQISNPNDQINVTQSSPVENVVTASVLSENVEATAEAAPTMPIAEPAPAALTTEPPAILEAAVATPPSQQASEPVTSPVELTPVETSPADMSSDIATNSQT